MWVFIALSFIQNHKLAKIHPKKIKINKQKNTWPSWASACPLVSGEGSKVLWKRFEICCGSIIELSDVLIGLQYASASKMCQTFGLSFPRVLRHNLRYHLEIPSNVIAKLWRSRTPFFNAPRRRLLLIIQFVIFSIFFIINLGWKFKNTIHFWLRGKLLPIFKIQFDFSCWVALPK